MTIVYFEKVYPVWITIFIIYLKRDQCINKTIIQNLKIACCSKNIHYVFKKYVLCIKKYLLFIKYSQFIKKIRLALKIY